MVNGMAGIWIGHSWKSSEEMEGRSSQDGRGWKLSLLNLFWEGEAIVPSTERGREQLKLKHSPSLAS